MPYAEFAENNRGVFMRQFMIYLVMLFLTINTARADMFNIQLSSESGRFIYATEVFGGQYGPVDMELGLYFNEDDDTVGHVGMLVRNDTLDNPLVISVGARLYYGDVGNSPTQLKSDVGAMAIGGELLFIPDNLGGLGFGFHYYVAPSIVSFFDADGFTEYGVRLDYALTQQASVYIGYQKIEADLDNGTKLEIDSSGFFGIGLRF